MSGGMMGGGNDMSAYTYNPQMRAQAQALGVNPLSPEQVNPNAVLPNSGFFGAHPRFAQALEGGLFGAANTRGADTWGEGISNIAQGLIQGRAQRAEMLGRQFEAPFAQAEQMGRLKNLQSTDELHEAMIQHYRAQTEALENKPDPQVKELNATGPAVSWMDEQGIHFAKNPYYQPKQDKPDNPEQQAIDKKEAELGRPLNYKEQLQVHEDFKKREPQPAQPKMGPWGTAPDLKHPGQSVFYQGTSGSPIPQGWTPFAVSNPINIQATTTPIKEENTERQEQIRTWDKNYEEEVTKGKNSMWARRIKNPMDETQREAWFIQKHGARPTMQQPASTPIPQPNAPKKLTDPSVAQGYLKRAGGDVNKARQLATSEGWSF